MSTEILVADIGGTNARFGIAHKHGDHFHVNDVQSFRAEDFETPRDAADAYLEAVRIVPKKGCFAVAAPIQGKIIPFTNSHWKIDIAETKAALRLSEFRLINDFHALAAGVAHLPDQAFEVVKPGNSDPRAPIIVLGPGTGLGQAIIVRHSGHQHIVSTEGGHVSFAPTTELEIEVLRFITKEHTRVSVERLLSGRGLVNIHRALCVIHDVPRISLQADEITKAAVNNEFPVAVEAVTMFCSILGSVAGDAVLSTGSRGGVILGGGILPKIKDFFLASPFLARFHAKGRMKKYVESVPIRLIVAEGAALYGAAAALQEQYHVD